MASISVIMGVYNGSQYIDKAIESIINQTYQDWEFIICDDGSTDNTVEIINKYRTIDKRIKLIQNNKNLGLSASLNRCIDIATGEYLARQDADDISDKFRLEEQISYLNAHENIAILGTYVNLMDKYGFIWGSIKYPEIPSIYDWIKRSSVVHASVIMRKNCVIDVGKYDINATRVEDYDLWLKMISKGYNIATLPKALYNVRWDIDDYDRRKFKYRIIESKVRFKWYRKLKIPLYYYIYGIKPLIVGIIPKKNLFNYHVRIFKNS